MTLKVKAAGSTIKSWVDGSLKNNVTVTSDDLIPWGAVALSGWQARFDDLKVGYDNNADDDIDDAGDDVVISEDFQGTAVAPTHDANGNLTKDADYTYVYDAWNNLVKVQAQNDADVVVATYEVYGDNRRAKKTVNKRGDLDSTGVFYYDGPREIAEYNSAATTGTLTQAYVWGTQYVDELLMMFGRNGAYFAWQDANWNVIGLTTPGGKVAEEYNYTPYGRVLARPHTVFGDGDGDGDVDAADQTAFTAAKTTYDRDFDANWDGTVDAEYDEDAFDAQSLQARADKTVTIDARAWSPIGNPYLYTGRRLDAETGIYYYRARNDHPGHKQFIQRDPLQYIDGPSMYQYVRGGPLSKRDPFGMGTAQATAVAAATAKVNAATAAFFAAVGAGVSVAVLQQLFNALRDALIALDELITNDLGGSAARVKENAVYIAAAAALAAAESIDGPIFSKKRPTWENLPDEIAALANLLSGGCAGLTKAQCVEKIIQIIGIDLYLKHWKAIDKWMNRKKDQLKWESSCD